MQALSPRQLGALVLAVSVVSLPLFFSVSFWLLVFLSLVVLWRIQIQRTVVSYPNNAVKAFAIGLVIAFLILRFSTFLSVETFVSLFLLSFYLKFLEIKSPRQAIIMFIMIFLALACSFLFYQTIWLSAYCLVCLICVIAAWRLMQTQVHVAISRQLYSSITMCIQVLPVMLILFVVMPRLGQLWAIPNQTETGVTGFSDEMQPGSLSELIESDAIAFRVSFEGVAPRPSERYWRGFVLENFDGRRWSRESKTLFSAKPVRGHSMHPLWRAKPKGISQKYTYSVLMEAHQQQGLFSLKVPERVHSSQMPLGFGSAVEILSPFSIGSRMEYQVTSDMSFTIQASGLSSFEQERVLKLPSGNERTKQFAKNQFALFSDDKHPERRYLQRILSLYNQSFVYTLRPAKLGEHSVDEFLFDTRRGFCEHFASSFVFLARAVGIPARVVVGYQGGEWNSNKQYLMVRQSDAHAWAEVWLDGEGWVRFDPTAAVSPLRIERGLRQAVPVDELGLVGSWSSNHKMLSWFNHRMDALSFSWQKFVLNYDERNQQDLFKNVLGGIEAWRVALFLLSSIGLCLLMYFLWNVRPLKHVTKSRFDRFYHQHLRDLERKGYIRSRHETPIQFAERVGSEHPALKTLLLQFAGQYCRMQYGAERLDLKRFHVTQQACRAALSKIKTSGS